MVPIPWRTGVGSVGYIESLERTVQPGRQARFANERFQGMTKELNGSDATVCSTAMSPLEASEFNPEPSLWTTDDKVTIPPVDCGKGFRQLEWLEEIQIGDEYLGGMDGDRKWVPVSFSIGARYRPHTANSIYAPWSITRRKVSQ